MPRKAKETDYSPVTMARHLIFERAEAIRMGEDGRLTKESTAHTVANAIDATIELLFVQWLKYRSEMKGYIFDRSRWDRTKWERKVVGGQAKEPYRTRYLDRALLNEGQLWADENYGREVD